MGTMNISLPDALKSFVDEQAYLVSYVERDDHVDVRRVLHGRRDLPARMREPGHA